MSFKVEFPDGSNVYISGLHHSVFTTYRQLEDKARVMAEKVGGTAYYESGMPRFQKDGVDLFPRWLPLGKGYTDKENWNVYSEFENFLLDIGFTVKENLKN